nr:Blue light- and temperature-regulated antirepressor YcgF [Klebsiella pneumoniae]
MLTTLIYRSRVHPDRPPVDLDALVHRASSKICPLASPAFCCLTACSFPVPEGTEEALESLFSEIQSDPRHRDVVELMRDYSAYRRFHGTGMRILDLRLFETDGALEEILRFSTFGSPNRSTTGCSGCLAPSLPTAAAIACPSRCSPLAG